LALSDRGRPSFDHELAGKLAALGAPAFTCTPDQFPGLMARRSSGAASSSGRRPKASC